MALTQYLRARPPAALGSGPPRPGLRAVSGEGEGATRPRRALPRPATGLAGKGGTRSQGLRGGDEGSV